MIIWFFSNPYGQIITIKSDGGNMHVLPIEGWVTSPHWNLAGDKIISVMMFSGDYPNSKLVIMDYNGENMRFIEYDENAYDASFSNNDSIVLFKDIGGIGLTAYNIHTGLVDYNALYSGSMSAFTYVLHPDGQKVVVCEAYGYMYLMNLLTDEYTLLRESCRTKSYSCPSFTSDGKSLIVFRRHMRAIGPSTRTVECNPYVIDLETDYEERLILD